MSMLSKIMSSVCVVVWVGSSLAASPVVAEEAHAWASNMGSSVVDSPAHAVMRIRFAPGATSASVQGTISTGTTQDYLLRAFAGQTLMLSLSSTDANARVSVYRRYFRRALAGRGDAMNWVARLPVSGDYVIRVTAAHSATFDLGVTVPERITFRRGAISATVKGKTEAHRTVTYLLRAREGQMMTVTLTPTNVLTPNILGLTIYGFTDGQPLVRAESDALSWSGKLPATQDYVIEAVPAIEEKINFTLKVIVR
jgi:hypothetical protein